MNNGYTNDRMNLVEVCKWLETKGYISTAVAMAYSFSDHVWNVNGMLRTDVIKEVLDMHNDMLFRELECEVTTHMEFISGYAAHIN